MNRILFLALPFLVTPAMAQESAGDVIQQTYICARNVEIPVTFVNTAEGESYAVAMIDGQMRAMHQVVSASGARYRTGEGKEAYQIWTKGDDLASVSYGAEDDETILFQDCTGRE